MISVFPLRGVLLAPAILLALAVPAQAQQAELDQVIAKEAFLRPPSAIADAVLAPRHLNVMLGNPSPDRSHFLRQQSEGPPAMAAFAKPFYRLGGLQIDHRANRARQMTTRGASGFDLIDWRTGQTTSVQIPAGLSVSGAEWSPDGSRVAFFAHTEDATHIYVADASNGRSRQVTRSPVLATLNTSIEWTPDSRSIVTVLLPANRGAPPAAPAVPTSPQVRLTTPDKNRLRTYPSLLQDQHEKDLLEYYTTGQLAIVDVQSRATRNIGAPAMIRNVDVSPDGRLARVATMRKPFSYIVPVSQFGGAEEIWSLEDGRVLATLSEQGVRDGSPADTASDPTNPEKRSVAWRPDGQGLSFLQQEPRAPGDTAQADTTAAQGQGNNRPRRRDRVMQWKAPFDENGMEVIYQNDTRLSNVRYSADAQVLFLTEQQGQNRHEFAVFLSEPGKKYTITRGPAGRGGFGGFGGGGGGPDGNLLTKALANGTSVVQVSGDGNSVFLQGVKNHEKPTEQGPRSFIDKVEIRTGTKTRTYESENQGVWERVIEVIDDDATQLIVSREGPADVPDSFFRNVQTGELRQLTQNTDYTPDLTNAKRQRHEITRVDGFKFAAEVTLPQDWTPGTRLPGMIWFYPREYTGQDNYNESLESYNKNRFPNLSTRSMDILVRAGYAVIQPDAPIIGEEGRMNDNYVADLRNNLAATIDFYDREGIIDRQRMGVGGHSYGAFSTVNAMVHTPFFKAGIAGDGNFNRTLTPLAFQTERRSIWDDRDLYIDMSPLLHANNMNGALLMYHGADDQNVGTFPINSWRLFESLEFLGKTASLYVYPYEDHGPATEETLLDLWARWTAWLDKYVKQASGEKVTTEDSGNR